jgi:hypothetical protein
MIVDCFFRSTELLKKHPADLIYLDRILAPYEIPEGSLLRCYYANITVNAMYHAQILPHLTNPVRHLEAIRAHDSRYHKNLMRNLRYYLIDEEGIRKFAQALRVRDYVQSALSPKQKRDLIEYVRGYYA